MYNGTIMIVEDEVVVGADIREKVEQLGYTVCPIVRYGEKVLNAALLEKPNLILMDIKLKGKMDGVEAARNLHKHLKVPVVFITAYSDNDTLSRAKVAEPYAYIRKPISMEDLRINIEIALYKAEMNRKLQESEERYKAFVEGTNDLITRVDNDGVFIFVNHMSKKILGLAPQDCVGKLAFDFIHPDDKEPTKKWFNNIIAIRKKSSVIENRQVSQSGKIHHMLWTSNFNYDSSGNLIGVNGIARDISDRKIAEADRDRLIAELRESLLKIKTLRGLLPICTSCKKIRDDKGYWNQIESYIRNHSEVVFSHGICPECAKKLYPDYDIYEH